MLKKNHFLGQLFLLVTVFSFFTCANASDSQKLDTREEMGDKDLPYVSQIVNIKNQNMRNKKVYEVTTIFTEPQILKLINMLHDDEVVDITYSISEVLLCAKLIKHEGKYYYFISNNNYFLDYKEKKDQIITENIIKDNNNTWRNPKGTAEDVAKIIFLTIKNGNVCYIDGSVESTCEMHKAINFKFYNIKGDDVIYSSPEEFLKEAYSSETDYYDALYLATAKRDLTSVTFFKDKNIDVNREPGWGGSSPLELAVENGYTEIEKVLRSAPSKTTVLYKN
jgi:hypothetical protein